MKTHSKHIAKKIFKLLAERWPHASCELIHNNEFQLLLAVVLSAQTTDKAVNKALAPILAEMPKFSAYDLLEMGQEKFLEKIKTIGLAPTKAKNSLALAKQICEKFGGKVPLQRQDLEDLPGVGRKTANVVLNVLCQMPTMAVDTHVARLAYRIGLVSEAVNRLEIEKQLLAVVPPEYAVQAHHYLIFHGRYLCSARAPKCHSCCLAPLCLKRNL